MRIAVVEDEKREAKILTDRLARYAEEHDIAAEIEWFPDAVIFLARFRPVYDIVFMDIDMPDLSGMDAAKKLREIDHIVPLVFVTALPSFAVQGYSVDASDYIVKPYSYAALESALGRINVKRGRDIILANTGGTRRLPLD